VTALSGQEWHQSVVPGSEMDLHLVNLWVLKPSFSQSLSLHSHLSRLI